ncbi:MAG: manganese efflux pump [Clostridia bacterium]|nr:manganese efflux pump [Clostridia bacterium]
MLTKEIIEIFILSLILSVDSFVTGFSYGISKIKITFSKCFLISFICSIILFLSLLIGFAFSWLISNSVSKLLSFLMMFSVGLIKFILDTFGNKIEKQNSNFEKFFFNEKQKKYLKIFVDTKKADIDDNKFISSFESLILAISLSVDSFGVGISLGLSSTYFLIAIISLFFTFFAIYLGDSFGKKISKNIKVNLSFLCGLSLMIIAVLKFII